jgi:hypothetical protein
VFSSYSATRRRTIARFARDPYRVALAEHEPSMLDIIALPTELGSAHMPQVCIDALPYAQWIEAATRRLQAEWPDADPRRLRDITDELFADPRSGLLEPVQAVQGWLQLLSGHD